MEPFYPAALWTVLQTFRSCFSKPTWPYFLGYIWALMVHPGRKCLTQLAYVCFPIRKSLSSWERFLAEYIWNLDGVVTLLVKLLLQRLHQGLLYLGTYVIVAVDTTLIAKASRKMFGVQNWHDSSSNPDRGSTMRGHHWGVFALVSRWQERWLSWPVLVRLITTRGQWKQSEHGLEPMSFWDLVLAGVYHLQTLIHFPLLVVADAYFSKAPFLNPLIEAGVKVVTRLRADSKGWDDPLPNQPGKRGPKPKRGKEWRLSDLLKVLPRQTAKVWLYGKKVDVYYVSRVVWLREVQQKVTVVVLKAAIPILFISTDLNLTPVQIVEVYGSRFSIEIAIREMKSQFGWGDYQCTSYLAIQRFMHLACVAFSLWRLALLEALENLDGSMPVWLSLPVQPSYISESPLSFERIRRALRRGAIRQINFRKSALLADLDNYSQADSWVERLIA